MEVVRDLLSGAKLIAPKIFVDSRGNFTKTFHHRVFRSFGINFDVKEEFFSFSKKGVLRGMHFQIPPYDHAKFVYCPRGAVLDVILDIRKASSTYGVCEAVELSAENGNILVIPRGFAHGFLSLEEDTLMIYKTTCEYNAEHDMGIHWNSFGFDWGENEPIVSARDMSFPSLRDFDSPF